MPNSETPTQVHVLRAFWLPIEQNRRVRQAAARSNIGGPVREFIQQALVWYFEESERADITLKEFVHDDDCALYDYMVPLPIDEEAKKIASLKNSDLFSVVRGILDLYLAHRKLN